MVFRTLTCTCFVLYVLCHQGFSQAPNAADLDAIRGQIQSLRTEYEKRLQTLESQLQMLQGQMQAGEKPETPAPEPAPVQQQQPTVQTPVGAQGAGGPAVALPVYGGASGSKIFNPDIGVIGNFLSASGVNKVNPSPLFQMRESEASFQAIVDPYARADFFLAFGEEGVELEEGYITFPAVPGGLLTRAGKMRSSFGKVNLMHSHNLPWTDRPLVTENLVGGEDGITDAGISISRLIPNPWIFLEATAQAYRGDSSNVFFSNKRGHLNYVGHLRGYGDVSESANIDLGFSYARGFNDAGFLTGVDFGDFRTTLLGGDATIRWRPLRRSIYRSFIGRSEWIWSRRGQPNGVQSASGFYVSGDFQFARRWTAGLRYDSSKQAADPSRVDKGQSALLTFFPSEFSQIRGQYRRTKYAVGPTANELLMQLQFSIGAHGAHPF